MKQKDRGDSALDVAGSAGSTELARASPGMRLAREPQLIASQQDLPAVDETVGRPARDKLHCRHDPSIIQSRPPDCRLSDGRAPFSTSNERADPDGKTIRPDVADARHSSQIPIRSVLARAPLAQLYCRWPDLCRKTS